MVRFRLVELSLALGAINSQAFGTHFKPDKGYSYVGYTYGDSTETTLKAQTHLLSYLREKGIKSGKGVGSLHQFYLSVEDSEFPQCRRFLSRKNKGFPFVFSKPARSVHPATSGNRPSSG